MHSRASQTSSKQAAQQHKGNTNIQSQGKGTNHHTTAAD